MGTTHSLFALDFAHTKFTADDLSCCRPSVGGDLITLVISKFSAVSSAQGITVYFGLSSQSVLCQDVSIAFSTVHETRLTIMTPTVDLGQDTSATAVVSIAALVDVTHSVTFNYTFNAMLQRVESFSPSMGMGKDKGGDLVWANIKYFQYPTSGVTVQVGDVYAASKVADTSSKSSTLISFVMPPGLAVGLTIVKMYPTNCSQPCKGLVTFLFLIKSSKALVLVQPVPISASFQQLSILKAFPAVRVQNLDLLSARAERIVGNITSGRFGTIQTTCSKIVTQDNVTFSIWLYFPGNIIDKPAAVTLSITIQDDDSRSVSLPFQVFDGMQPPWHD